MSNINSQPSAGTKRTHLTEKDAQLFFERENWATLVANRVENWPQAKDSYGRNYVTIVLYQSQNQYVKTIKKLIEGGLPHSNSLFFALPHQVGSMDNAEAQQTIEYFQYLQSLGLDIHTVDEYENNLFIRLEKNFNGQVFHYLLTQKVKIEPQMIARLIALIDEEEHQESTEHYMNNFYHHQNMQDDRVRNEELTGFIYEYLIQESESLKEQDFKLLFDSFKLSYNKLMDFYGSRGLYQVSEAMGLYYQQPLKDKRLFSASQIKIIEALELVSGKNFLINTVN
jgi:hypothetical protein